VKDVRRCYICNKLGHVAKFCETSIKEKEASGSLSKIEGKAKPTLQYGNKPNAAKQVSKKPTSVDVKKGQSQPSSNRVSVDPVSLLYSLESDSGVDMVRVCDQGSRPQHVNIEIQGVSTSGVIDTGADITIMGGELFKKVAKAAKLKKDFKKADRTPCTYDRKH